MPAGIKELREEAHASARAYDGTKAWGDWPIEAQHDFWVMEQEGEIERMPEAESLVVCRPDQLCDVCAPDLHAPPEDPLVATIRSALLATTYRGGVRRAG